MSADEGGGRPPGEGAAEPGTGDGRESPDPAEGRDRPPRTRPEGATIPGDERSGYRPYTRETEDERFLAGPRFELGPVLDIAKDSWRIFRIMGEFVEGFEALGRLGPAVSFFGSARVRPEDPLYQACVETARRMGEAGFNVMTGGGPGMMEAANRGAREAGVVSVGCSIELPFEQGTNPFVDLAVDFRYFFVRKTMFVKYAEAFVIFPGGFGTMDELFEALTLIQTGKVRDFPVVLFGSEYWGGLLDWLDARMAREGKISPADMELLLVTDSPEEAARHVAERFEAYRSADRDRRAAVRPDRRGPKGAGRTPPPAADPGHPGHPE